MGDEYEASLIVEELRESCPGPTGCHGCQNWCPECGSVPNVCDDPACDSHRRDTDVKADIDQLESEMTKCAAECEREERRFSKTGPPRTDLQCKARKYEQMEKERRELEEELLWVTQPGANMVPREAGAKRVPRDR